MVFTPYKLTDNLMITDIYTCYYFEHSNRKKYVGESHDFWEIVYVDKGEVNANTGSGYYHLNQGNILIHSPNEYHCLESTATKAPNLFIVTFHCDSEDMNYFDRHKLFNLTNREQAILAKLMREGKRAFHMNTAPLCRNEQAEYGSEQLFKVYLIELLLTMIRNAELDRGQISLIPTTKENQTEHLVRRVIHYLEQHLSEKLTLDQICTQMNIGKTQLNIMFKRATGLGVMAYSNRLKIERAKKLIREEAYNLSEISNLLGYNSIHYFSRQFKQMEGMAPSEYAKTMEAHHEQ